MVAFPSPLGGNIGARTGTVYRLDPVAFTAPLEPIIDIIPGLSPFRTTVDLIDSENKSNNYSVTQYPIQFGRDVTTHVRKQLKMLTITATLGATLPMLPTAGIIPTGSGVLPFTPGVIPVLPVGNDFFVPKVPPVPGDAFRSDLIRLRNLEAMADSLLPVMVITPRVSLSRAFFTNVTHNWTPELGQSTTITMSFVEANIVSILPQLPSDEGLAPGNNVEAGGGAGSTTPVDATSTPSATPGVPPTVV